jgi:hypothetical protein
MPTAVDRSCTAAADTQHTIARGARYATASSEPTPGFEPGTPSLRERWEGVELGRFGLGIASSVGLDRVRFAELGTWFGTRQRGFGGADTELGADGALDPSASRSGDKAQMLAVCVRHLTGKLLVQREHCTQRVERVLARLLSRAALAHRTWNLKHAGDNPGPPHRAARRQS